MQSKEINRLRKNLDFLCITCFYVAIFSAVMGTSSLASEKLTVYTVNYPLKYFAERIAGEHAQVIFPAPVEGDPAYWMPDQKTISDYQRADLILLNGAGYAKWVGKVTLPRSKMVDTSRKYKNRYIIMEEVVTHSHGAEGKHAHESLAFTTWLDFELAAGQAKSIEKSLGRKSPGLKDTFMKNYAGLEADLLTLDREIKSVVQKDPAKPLVASHPVYDYLAKRYGLNLKSVHWEPDQVPTDMQLAELETLLRDHPAKCMIWEGEPVKESVERLNSLGINSVVFDPCGNMPEKDDFLSVMKKNIQNIRRVFE